MTLTALYVAANEGANIAESMRSVKAYVDRFVIIDSIFTSNPDPATRSSDNQRSEAERAAGQTELCYYQSPVKVTETEARNIALCFLNPGDWGLIIDGDECLYGDHDAVSAITSIVKEEPVLRALAIPVFTTAILHDGDAPSMSRAEHAEKPLISTSALMIRLFRMTYGLHYELPAGHITPMLVEADGEVLVPDIERDQPFIINRHATQPYDVYQNDYVWETGARAP